MWRSAVADTLSLTTVSQSKSTDTIVPGVNYVRPKHLSAAAAHLSNSELCTHLVGGVQDVGLVSVDHL